MAFSVKDWENVPSAATPINAAALEDMETRLSNYAALLFSAYNVLDYGADNTGATDCLAEIQAACDAAANAGGGVVYLPAGEYLIDGVLSVNQFVCFRGAGMRETVITLNDASSSVLFNEHGGPTNSRGGQISGFHIDGQSVATTCMEVQVAVNRTFSDFRISNIGASGIGLLVHGAQNCNFHDFDIQANTGSQALTTGVKLTDSAGSCRFAGYSILGCDYAGIWVTQTNSGGQFGIGYPEPRYCSFDNGIVEHGDPDTCCAVRVHSARDLWFTRQALFVATDQPSSGAYTIVEVNDAGAGTTAQVFFDTGTAQGGTDPQKDSTAFDIQAGSSTYRTRITNYTFGNNTFGVVAASGQTVEVDCYRNTSTDTLFSGSGTITRRAFGATAYTTS